MWFLFFMVFFVEKKTHPEKVVFPPVMCFDSQIRNLSILRSLFRRQVDGKKSRKRTNLRDRWKITIFFYRRYIFTHGWIFFSIVMLVFRGCQIPFKEVQESLTNLGKTRLTMILLAPRFLYVTKARCEAM